MTYDRVMELLFASSNPHKLDEVAGILAACGVTVVGVDAVADRLAGFDPPEETGSSFEANARIKARAYARAAGRRCLADDSGLSVDALNGAPGVHSARYAGVGADRPDRDSANNRKLLDAMHDVPEAERTARFVCAMCLADDDGNVLAETLGTFEGVIAEAPSGVNGFGYDPLLYLPDEGCTSAALTPEQKNARSHRGAAARAIAAWLNANA